MLELDVLLVPFLQQRFRDLDVEDQQRFEKLLECEDQDIFRWVMGHLQPEDPELARIVDLLLEGVPK